MGREARICHPALLWCVTGLDCLCVCLLAAHVARLLTKLCAQQKLLPYVVRITYPAIVMLVDTLVPSTSGQRSVVVSGRSVILEEPRITNAAFARAI
jgi:hypothetical protein